MSAVIQLQYICYVDINMSRCDGPLFNIGKFKNNTNSSHIDLEHPLFIMRKLLWKTGSSPKSSRSRRVGICVCGLHSEIRSDPSRRRNRGHRPLSLNLKITRSRQALGVSSSWPVHCHGPQVLFSFSSQTTIFCFWPLSFMEPSPK